MIAVAVVVYVIERALDLQDLMVMPVGAASFSEALAMVARAADGQWVHLPVQQNLHRDGILAVTQVPAPGATEAQRAQAIACIYSAIKAQAPDATLVSMALANLTTAIGFGTLSPDDSRLEGFRTVFKGRSIMYRRDNVGLAEFDDALSRHPDPARRIDFAEFIIHDDAVDRIATLVQNHISTL